MSNRLLHTYIETYDFNRLFFTQSDINDFEKKYEHELDDAIWLGDLKPAQVIYDLYLKRVEARVAKIKTLLETEKFDFDGHGTIEISRQKAPWPKDEADADRLWHDRIENELLTERLAETTRGRQEARQGSRLTRPRLRRLPRARRKRRQSPEDKADKAEGNARADRRQALRPAAAFAPRADQGRRGQVFPQRAGAVLRPAQRVHEPERDGEFLHQHAPVADRHRCDPAQGGRVFQDRRTHRRRPGGRSGGPEGGRQDHRRRAGQRALRGRGGHEARQGRGDDPRQEGHRRAAPDRPGGRDRQFQAQGHRHHPRRGQADRPGSPCGDHRAQARRRHDRQARLDHAPRLLRGHGRLACAVGPSARAPRSATWPLC